MRPAHHPPILTNQSATVLIRYLIVASFLASLDQTIVDVAIPRMVLDLGHPSLVTWVVSAYTITYSCVVAIAGCMSDVYGRNVTFQTCVLIFLAASIVCTVAPSMFILLLARGAQGVGAGGMQALAYILAADVVPPTVLPNAYAKITVGYVVAAVLGPFVGGSITEAVGWRWVFYANIPFCILIPLATWTKLRLVDSIIATKSLQSNNPKLKVDFVGCVIFLFATVALLLAITWGAGRTFAWSSPIMVSLLVASAVSYAGFVVFEVKIDSKTSTRPMLDMSMFRNRSFVVGFSGIFLVGMVVFNLTVFPGIYFQWGQNLSPIEAGVRTLPVAFSICLAGAAGGIYVLKTGKYRLLPCIGMAVTSCGLAMLQAVNRVSSYWFLVFALFISGFGIGVSLQVILTAVQNSVQPSQTATATSALAFIRYLGGAIAIVVGGCVLDVTEPTSKKITQGTHQIFLLTMIPSVLSCCVLYCLPGKFLRNDSAIDSKAYVSPAIDQNHCLPSGSEDRFRSHVGDGIL